MLGRPRRDEQLISDSAEPGFAERLDDDACGALAYVLRAKLVGQCGCDGCVAEFCGRVECGGAYPRILVLQRGKKRLDGSAVGGSLDVPEAGEADLDARAALVSLDVEGDERGIVEGADRAERGSLDRRVARAE